jgi:copper chaperone CopZ
MILASTAAWASDREVVEIDVSGMTCPFCVYGTEKNLGKLPDVAEAVVSLDKKKARVVMAPGAHADIEAIRKAILDAGFSPGAVRVAAVEDGM